VTIVQLDRDHAPIREYGITRGIASQSWEVFPIGPVQDGSTVGERQIISDFVTFLINVFLDLMRQRSSRPQERKVDIAGSRANPQLLASPRSGFFPHPNMVALGNIIQALLPGHIRPGAIQQQRRHRRGAIAPALANGPYPIDAIAKGWRHRLCPASGCESVNNLVMSANNQHIR
jgi:hypothetical protein